MGVNPATDRSLIAEYVGAVALGAVTGYHFFVAGSSVTFLVRHPSGSTR